MHLAFLADFLVLCSCYCYCCCSPIVLGTLGLIFLFFTPCNNLHLECLLRFYLRELRKLLPESLKISAIRW